MTISDFIKSRHFLFLWISNFALNIITFVIVFFKIPPTGKTAALKYNVLTGVEWYGKGMNALVIPIAGVIITAVNFYLFKKIQNGQYYYPALLIFFTTLISLTLMASVLFLTTVN